MKEFKYHKISFNAAYVAGLSLADFTEQYTGKYFPSVPDEADKLKEVHEGCTAVVNETASVPALDVDPAKDENKG